MFIILKVIARLVSACRPAVQLSKIITINQLEHLIRMAVWNDQQQPWAVHAITCLLQVRISYFDVYIIDNVYLNIFFSFKGFTGC